MKKDMYFDCSWEITSNKTVRVGVGIVIDNGDHYDVHGYVRHNVKRKSNIEFEIGKELIGTMGDYNMINDNKGNKYFMTWQRRKSNIPMILADRVAAHIINKDAPIRIQIPKEDIDFKDKRLLADFFNKTSTKYIFN